MGPDRPRDGFVPSILDRLLDHDAEESGRRGVGLARALASVRRDLEQLLNTHRSSPPLPSEFAELEASVFTYGMPDPSALSALAEHQGAAIGHLIEAVVGRFEPRLRDVEVRPVASANPHHRQLHFEIKGRLQVEPYSEVEFETILELATGYTTVRPVEA